MKKFLLLMLLCVAFQTTKAQDFINNGPSGCDIEFGYICFAVVGCGWSPATPSYTPVAGGGTQPLGTPPTCPNYGIIVKIKSGPCAGASFIMCPSSTACTCGQTSITLPPSCSPCFTTLSWVGTDLVIQ